MQYLINLNNSGERLDKFLAANLSEFSRAQIQKKIKEKNILVNNNPASAHLILKAGDKITFSEAKEKKEKNVLAKKAGTESLKLFKKVKIIAAEKDYLVIDKPAGLIVHGAPHIEEPNLADFLAKQYPELKKAGGDQARPGIVHRLDKEASGLMIIARTPNGFAHFKKLFQKRLMQKEYFVLVYGAIERDHGIINFPIKRSSRGHKMAAIPESQTEKESKAKEAISEFWVEKKFINYTFLRVKIKTGRTHQIRAHLAAYAHPVVGDNLYGTRKNKEKNAKLALGRIFLVAAKLAFKDLNKEDKTYKIELPAELKKLLKIIK